MAKNLLSLASKLDEQAYDWIDYCINRFDNAQRTMSDQEILFLDIDKVIEALDKSIAIYVVGSDRHLYKILHGRELTGGLINDTRRRSRTYNSTV